MHRIPRDTVDEVLEESDVAFLIAGNLETLPTLGDVPVTEQRIDIDVESYEIKMSE